MLKEYDIVTAKKDINSKVLKGANGTVLIIHNANPLHYEVEFIDKHGDTLDLLTVSDSDIEKKAIN